MPSRRRGSCGRKKGHPWKISAVTGRKLWGTSSCRFRCSASAFLSGKPAVFTAFGQIVRRMTYWWATRREGGNVEGPPGVFLRASCIRLEGSSARRDVCPQQPPITSIVFLWKAFFYFSSLKERAPPRFLYRPGYNYIFTFRVLDKLILPWSKTQAEKKNLSLIGAARRVLSSRASPLCGIGRAILKSLARVISRRGINFNSDKNSALRQREMKVWGQQVKE